MKGPTEIWFVSYILRRRGVSWDDFVIDVCARFRDNLGGKVIEEFNRLQQDGTIDEYLAKFEELKALMLLRARMMPISYFLQSFIRSLKPATKSLVKDVNPQKLDIAIEQAMFHEEQITPSQDMKPVSHILIVEICNVRGIDFMGPFPPSFGFVYVLVDVDLCQSEGGSSY